VEPLIFLLPQKLKLGSGFSTDSIESLIRAWI
jgi:hypothetical protein